MDLQFIKKLYGESRQISIISDSIDNKTNLHLKGLTGSALSVVASATFEKKNIHHLFIMEDREEAAFFHNDLNSLNEKKDVLFFPDSFKRPGKFDEMNNSNVRMRTEVVNQLAHSKTRGELIVTYPEALFERVVKSEMLYEHSIEIIDGEYLDTNDLIEKLHLHQFEMVDFVYEPGQFSVRGGIIDIFSYGNDHPYRIELFDKEVESIRNFDPNSQLSTKKIASFSIVPNIQTDFKLDEKTSFLNIILGSTVVWVKDINALKEILDDCMEKAEKVRENIVKESMNHPGHPLLEGEANHVFQNSDDVLNNLNALPVIECGNTAVISKEVVNFNTKPQPSFNKQFDLLIENIKELESNNFKCLIFSDNPRQIERFYNIFEDLKAGVEFYPFYHAIHQGYIDEDLKLACYTDHQIFNRYHKYKLKQGFSRDQALLKKQLSELSPGDFVTHIDHGVGVFSGLEKIEVNGHVQESVRIKYADNDLLYVSIQSLHKISKYSGKEGNTPRINKLGSDSWNKLKKRTKRKIKDIAEDLIKLYAKRKAQKGFAFNKDTYLQTELEASFVYEDTPDQNKATKEIKKDMEDETPMDRLVCGDVGFGKTELAIRAAFKAVADSKQVALLVPTTILAMQHYRTFQERLEDFPCDVAFVNRFKSAKQKTEILKQLKEGKLDIIIGTHALAGKKVEFKDLGLLIIDEEQKFGVSVKDKLKEMKVNVDTLTLTATPIPRTLQFSMMGARDMSILRTPPPNRQSIQTEVHTFDPEVIKESIEYEVYRGGQVFFVHNRIKDIVEVKAMLQKIIPNIDVAVAHGQMDGKELEKIMLAFINREYDVLLCTSIIESGLDIPNANTIIINNAHMFGLSDLHQLRGRVGRSNKKAFCYLFRPPVSTLTREARQRLKTIEEFADLGSGINIAMRDLDIRGAGNLLGAEQSGFISEIGFDMYHKILDEALRELKETEFKDLYAIELNENRQFIQDCQIETDLDMLIPDAYVTNINERLSLYTELNNIKNEEELDDFRSNLVDRFGPLPIEVFELFNAIRLKWLALKIGFDRILFKNNILKCFFVDNKESPYYESKIFGEVLTYIQTHPEDFSLKQTPKHLILTIEPVETMEIADEKLERIQKYVEDQFEGVNASQKLESP
ncbi:MAG: transcription-repair coupling factor [Chitinophagales bacterium]|nr:transcription-repair coupling factor [Chitinophagales bacterium]